MNNKSTKHTLAEYELIYPPRNLPEGAEVVRIAPSPTGKPHIGGKPRYVRNRTLTSRNHDIYN